jgi:hypothetical protein
MLWHLQNEHATSGFLFLQSLMLVPLWPFFFAYLRWLNILLYIWIITNLVFQIPHLQVAHYASCHRSLHLAQIDRKNIRASSNFFGEVATGVKKIGPSC